MNGCLKIICDFSKDLLDPIILSKGQGKSVGMAI